MIKPVSRIAIISALLGGAAMAQTPVGDAPARARAADSDFISWREHIIDCSEVTGAPFSGSGARGAAVVPGFSPDAEQRHLHVVNQNSVMVDVLARGNGEKLASFGGGPGRYPGQLELPRGIGVDSRGNVYIVEQEGRRIQQFVPVAP